MKLFRLCIFCTLLLLAVSVAAQETMYTNRRGVRVRAEPTTTATVITTLRSGAAVTVIRSEEGGRVSGSTTWYYVRVGDDEGYIHSSLLTSVAPASAVPSTSSGTSLSSGASSSQAQSLPAPFVDPPAQSSSGASCNGATTCGQMVSCEQAYACLAAGRSSLDRDHDGVPCESICPGG